MSRDRNTWGAILGLLAVMTAIPMHSEETANSDLHQLTRALRGAYGNALRHETSAPELEKNDLQKEDLLLEHASIRLSSVIATKIANCQNTDTRCFLPEDAAELRNLTDMLSYAASRLQMQAKTAARSESVNPLHRFRVGSLEHLYRTVFALSKIYFDRSQSDAYARAAREQINLAKENLEKEQQLCDCNPQPYSDKLQELSELDEAVRRIAPTP